MKLSQKITRALGAVGVACGASLAVAEAASAQMMRDYSSLNPCPGIYYEAPFNTSTPSPEQCPPNAFTQQTGVNSQTIVDPASVSRPPLPEDRSDAIARVMPMNGMVDIRLTNNTNVGINYEVTGETQRYLIEGGESTVLRNITLPMTMTVVRTDDGWADVNVLSAEEGMIELGLDEDATPLDENQGVVRIQEDGQVFVN
jgi:hypothetical protein